MSRYLVTVGVVWVFLALVIGIVILLSPQPERQAAMIPQGQAAVVEMPNEAPAPITDVSAKARVSDPNNPVVDDAASVKGSVKVK